MAGGSYYADAVGALDTNNLPDLRSLLNDPRDDGKRGVRGNAAWRLGQLGDRESAVPIAALLTDHLMMVRLSAADALHTSATLRLNLH